MISKTTSKNIIKAAGAKRVTDKAAEELSLVLEEKGKQISEKAIKFSKHAGRRTILAADIKLVAKNN